MIKYMKIDFYLKPHRLQPPPFIGSTLRGVFGYSLKDVVCINPSFTCNGCFARENCLYYKFFEEKNKTHRYRFSFDLYQENYNFSLFLFEDACEKLPDVITALYTMLSEKGLGTDRTKFQIDHILIDGKVVFRDGAFDLHGITPTTFSSLCESNDITIAFLTPLRIKYNGKLLNHTPGIEILLYSILNRLHELKDLPKVKLPFTPKYKNKKSDINFIDFSRYSNRQKRKMQLGGIVGQMQVSDIDSKSLALLELGQIIGVGKQTAFGMGKIKILQHDK